MAAAVGPVPEPVGRIGVVAGGAPARWPPRPRSSRASPAPRRCGSTPAARAAARAARRPLAAARRRLPGRRRRRRRGAGRRCWARSPTCRCSAVPTSDGRPGGLAGLGAVLAMLGSPAPGRRRGRAGRRLVGGRLRRPRRPPRRPPLTAPPRVDHRLRARRHATARRGGVHADDDQLGGEVRVIGWLDLSAGASGDMLLGALVDAGVPLEVLGRRRGRAAGRAGAAHRRAATPGTAWAARGCTCTRRRPTCAAPGPTSARILADADLDDAVRDGALDVFERLAVAEGRVHRIAAGRRALPRGGRARRAGRRRRASSPGSRTWGSTRLAASPVALGSGSARGAHGVIPVPGPGGARTARRRAGRRRAGRGRDVHAHRRRAGRLARRRVRRRCRRCGCSGSASAWAAATRSSCRTSSGWCSGSRPSSLRRRAPVVLEANVDDLDPRLWPGVLDALFAAGASDAWLTPILMKKGRAAHTLSVLCRPEAVAARAGGGVRDDVDDRAAGRAGGQGRAGAASAVGRRARRPGGREGRRLRAAGWSTSASSTRTSPRWPARPASRSRRPCARRPPPPRRPTRSGARC